MSSAWGGTAALDELEIGTVVPTGLFRHLRLIGRICAERRQVRDSLSKERLLGHRSPNNHG